MRKILLSVACCFSCFLSRAQLSLSHIFTSNMVLQREAPIRVWGKATPFTEVKVNFASKERKVKTKKDSTWGVQFSPQPANTHSQNMVVFTANKRIELKNILVGDLWLLTGQSNMEFPLDSEMHFPKEKEQLASDQLRFYNPDFVGKGIYNQKFSKAELKKLTPGHFFVGKWEESGLPQVKALSAVGYYFGKKILQKEKIPIGLINLAIGGAPLETFLALKTLKKSAEFKGKVKGNWLENEELPVWVRKRGKQNVGGIAIHKDSLGPNHGYKPGFAYQAGIKPLLRLPIKGILWYQGESNAQEMPRVKEYAALQKLMIVDYRKKWGAPEMPFYWVQLSSIDSTNYKSNFWPAFRNEQRVLLGKVKHGSMAVSSDVGNKNSIHPTNKKTVGLRLARWALRQDYNENVVVSGPMPTEANFRSGKVRISFRYAGKGLHIANGKALQGFSLDGKHPVPAKIKGKQVIIHTNRKPEAVYYGWQPYSLGNLVNTEGLPTSTFKLEL